MQTAPRSELPRILTILMTGDDSDPQYSPQGVAPFELTLTIGAVGLLSADSQFVVYDPEDSTVPAVQEPSDDQIELFLSQEVGSLCSWEGSLPESSGYGDIRILETPNGRGLCVSVGGSVLSSAMSFWIIPV